MKQMIKAIIFSAGLGTRLRHLTQDCPKALVQINGKPLLWHAIQKLTMAGVEQITVNTHHFSTQIIDYLKQTSWNVPITISDESNSLLDTGGGLLKARPYLENASAIIGYNVDILSSINLQHVIDYHTKNNALATLVVRDRKTSRYLLFDEEMQLTGWKNTNTGEELIISKSQEHSTALAFSGIQVLSPEIFKRITETGKFSVTSLYLRLAASKKITGFLDQSNYWVDAGKPEHIEEAEKLLRMNQSVYG